MSPPPPSTWRALRDVLRWPGPPPAALPGTAFILLVLCLATVTILLWLGHAWHGDAHRYFEEHDAGTYLSAINLVGAGVASVLVARRLGGTPSAGFWWIAAAGFAWLALDELFALHERIDRSVHALLGLDPDHPITDRLDDLIVAAYGVAALGLAYAHRAHLLTFRWMLRFLVLAFPLYAAMVMADVGHLSDTVADALKVVAGTLIVVGFLSAWLQLVSPGGER